MIQKTILSKEERLTIRNKVRDILSFEPHDPYTHVLFDLTEQAIISKIEKEIDIMKIYRRESNSSKIDWNKTKEKLKQSLLQEK